MWAILSHTYSISCLCSVTKVSDRVELADDKGILFYGTTGMECVIKRPPSRRLIPPTAKRALCPSFLSQWTGLCPISAFYFPLPTFLFLALRRLLASIDQKMVPTALTLRLPLGQVLISKTQTCRLHIG